MIKRELISFVSTPFAPAPLNSTDEGEAWVWGDYFALLQTAPVTVLELTTQNTKNDCPPIPPIKYSFALSVYYQNSKSPYGMTTRPILIAALVSVDEESGTVVRSIRSNTNSNLGMFQGAITKERARERLFKVMADDLVLEGEPVKIGPIAAIHGHPNTGWPALKATKTSGCMSLWLLVIILGCAGVIALTSL